MAAADLIAVVAPELVGDERVTGAIEMAEAQVGPKFVNRDQAVAYLAAHIVTMGGREGFAGNIASRKEGDLSESYHVDGQATGYGATSYGREFVRLRNQCVFAARTRVQHV